MSDENEDFSLRRLMEQGEGGSIGEPYHVQTIFDNGNVRLDLPEVAATYYAELVAERDALAEKLAAALREAAEDVRQWGSLRCGAEDVTDEVASDILNLIPDAGGALDRAIAEAEARGMERAADLHDETFCDKRANKAYWQSDLIRAEAATIRARTKKDNTDD